MPDVVVLGFPRSTFVHIARLVLIHKQVPYTFRDLEPEMGSAAHLALHPFDRVPILQHGACPWLIKKFVDRDAEFIFVPADKVVDEAKRLNAILYDVKNIELGHHGKECSFEAILKKYKLSDDPALALLGKIVNGADTDNTLYQQPEAPGSKR